MHIFKNSFDIITFPCLSSTNTKAKEYIEDGTVIIADEQTSGKGRRTHQWHSPKGGLYMSLVLTNPDLSRLGIYSLAAGLATSLALPVANDLKWPNDILVNGKKISGILLETTNNPSRLIIGIGVNLISHPSPTELNTDYEATDLLNYNIVIERNTLVNNILNELRTIFALPEQTILKLWQSKSTEIGKEIKVSLAKDTYFGVFKGLSKDGSLILSQQLSEQSSRSEIIITAGYVTETNNIK